MKKEINNKKLSIKDLYQSLWLYMHTINGIPAQYEEGEQIVFANFVRGGGGIRRLCESLEQVKLEEKLSNKWRKEQGWDVFNDYGYVRILREFLTKNKRV